MGNCSVWVNDAFVNNKQNCKGYKAMINVIEKIIDWIDNCLPVIIIPWAIILLIRVVFQMITH